MKPKLELALIIRRFLHSCDLLGDSRAMSAAGLPPSQRHLLAEPAFWCGIGHLKPAVTAAAAIEWNELRSSAPAHASSPDYPLSPLEQLKFDICDYYRDCARSPARLEEAVAAGACASTIRQLRHHPRLAAVAEISVRVRVDCIQAEHIRKFLQSCYEELDQNLRLVSCGATYAMMQQISGISTHEFAALRRACGLEQNRGRLPQPTPAKERRI